MLTAGDSGCFLTSNWQAGGSGRTVYIYIYIYRIYHGWALSLRAGTATCPRRENGWEHMHSATPASRPAPCLHNIVYRARMKNHLMLHIRIITVHVNKRLTYMFWGGTSCLGSCVGLWTGWHCGEPCQLAVASPKEPVHQNIEVLWWTVHDLLLAQFLLCTDTDLKK